MKKLAFYLNNDRYKYRVYLFLNRPRNFFEIIYQVFLTVMIVSCIVVTMIMPTDVKNKRFDILFWFDLTISTIFLFEFIVRVWSSSCLPRYRGLYGVLNFILSPICLLDLFVIASTFTVLAFDMRENLLSVGLRGFRLLQFFENRYHLWRLIGSVIWLGRFQLAVCSYFCLILLISISFIIYFIEEPTNPKFQTVGGSIWFTLATFTTVGYGDTVPGSTSGKIVTGFAMVIGATIFALPAGIIGASLALKVEKEDKSKGSIRQVYAAELIQKAWHVYCTIKYCSSGGKVVESNGCQTTVRFSSSKMKHKLYLTKPYNRCSILFVHLLNFYLAKRRFKTSLKLIKSNNFYDTYTRNNYEQNERIRNLELNLNAANNTVVEIHQFIANNFENFTLLSNILHEYAASKSIISKGMIVSNNEDGKNLKRTKHCPSGHCWRCLNRRRNRRSLTGQSADR